LHKLGFLLSVGIGLATYVYVTVIAADQLLEIFEDNKVCFPPYSLMTERVSSPCGATSPVTGRDGGLRPLAAQRAVNTPNHGMVP